MQDERPKLWRDADAQWPEQQLLSHIMPMYMMCMQAQAHDQAAGALPKLRSFTSPLAIFDIHRQGRFIAFIVDADTM